MAEDLGDKTEAPTPRRLTEARERGNIARSADLSAALVLTSAIAAMGYFGSDLLSGLGKFMRFELGQGFVEMVDDQDTIAAHLTMTAVRAIVLAAPMVISMIVAAYAAHALQVGWLLTGRPLQPQWSRLNLLKGLGNLFSQRNLVKSISSVLKLLGVAAIAYAVVAPQAAALAALPALAPAAAFMLMGEILFGLAMWALAFLGVIGAIDFLYQRWKHTQDLKMTKQEVEDERKSTDGDPEVRARRMRIARQIALQRLRSAVPKADVVVTNPTHFAVALKYDAATMRAPRVVAKGADHLAVQIRLIAAQSGVPIVERPPLARALYASVKVGQEVPADQYEAVAEVLAYVYRIEGRRAG